MTRLGQYRDQEDFEVFIPGVLNPVPEIYWDDQLVTLLAEANMAIGRLDTLLTQSTEANLLKWMLMRMEALGSCRPGESTCSLRDLLRSEQETTREEPGEEREIRNYFHALRHAAKELSNEDQEINLKFIRALHEDIMRNKGRSVKPGEFRRGQTWIGTIGSTPRTALFVPPPAAEMNESLKDFELFLRQRHTNPLVHASLAHSQFESIHPFQDGNGRVCRAITILLLVKRGTLTEPVLPLSLFMAKHRMAHFRFLMGARQDDALEDWLKFFLTVMLEAAQESIRAIKHLLEMARSDEESLADVELGSSLLSYMRIFPILSIQTAASYLDCAYATGKRVLEELIDKGLVREVTGQKRNRQYEYVQYLQFWEDWELAIARNHQEKELFEKRVDEKESFSENVAKTGLMMVREGLHIAHLEEEQWLLSEQPLSLNSFFHLKDAWMVMTFSNKSGNTVEITPDENHTVPYRGAGPHLDIEMGSTDGPTRISWSFKFLEHSGRALWLAAWKPKSPPATSDELVQMCANELTRLAVARRLVARKESDREQELKGKHEIMEMFLAIRNVLGRQTDGDIFWEDGKNSSNLVYYYDDVRSMLWFSLDEIMRIETDELVKQRLRERISDAVKRLPMPPPRNR